MLHCYNRGCGSKFDPTENKEDSCRHHPGVPFFHDAYKGWTCCNRKTVDFTEFLNIKGCTLSKHSNEKPIEPDNKLEDKNVCIEMPQETRKPITKALDRPLFNTELIQLKPIVSPSLKNEIDKHIFENCTEIDDKSARQEIVGTTCKNQGCNAIYSSSEMENDECRFHPGEAVFHEGMKFWSCCAKKTSDFTAFLNQLGCVYGNHKWISDNDQNINCRYDWHQTTSNVIVTIYAKLYHYEKSTVSVNPIRLQVCLIFPKNGDAQFDLDLELRGIIKPESTIVKMYETKLEITMPKGEFGPWTALDFPKPKAIKLDEKRVINDSSDSDVDLDDIRPAT